LNNKACFDEGYGGALYISGNLSNATFENNNFRNNQANNGGAIYIIL